MWGTALSLPGRVLCLPQRACPESSPGSAHTPPGSLGFSWVGWARDRQGSTYLSCLPVGHASGSKPDPPAYPWIIFVQTGHLQVNVHSCVALCTWTQLPKIQRETVTIWFHQTLYICSARMGFAVSHVCAIGSPRYLCISTQTEQSFQGGYTCTVEHLVAHEHGNTPCLCYAAVVVPSINPRASREIWETLLRFQRAAVQCAIDSSWVMWQLSGSAFGQLPRSWQFNSMVAVAKLSLLVMEARVRLSRLHPCGHRCSVAKGKAARMPTSHSFSIPFAAVQHPVWPKLAIWMFWKLLWGL